MQHLNTFGNLTSYKLYQNNYLIQHYWHTKARSRRKRYSTCGTNLTCVASSIGRFVVCLRAEEASAQNMFCSSIAYCSSCWVKHGEGGREGKGRVGRKMGVGEKKEFWIRHSALLRVSIMNKNKFNSICSPTPKWKFLATFCPSVCVSCASLYACMKGEMLLRSFLFVGGWRAHTIYLVFIRE